MKMVLGSTKVGSSRRVTVALPDAATSDRRCNSEVVAASGSESEVNSGMHHGLRIVVARRESKVA